MKKNFTSATVEDLIDFFRYAAGEYENAINQADSRSANKNAKLAIRISDELFSRGIHSFLALKKLFDDKNPRVRSWAAAELWKISPMEAIAVMKKIASDETGLVRFSAEEFLRQKAHG